MNSDAVGSKGRSLLAFLRDAATLRRKRIAAYNTTADKVLWFGEVPVNRPECRSAFQFDSPAEFPDLWLEVRKKRAPIQPSPPSVVRDWIRQDDLGRIDHEPELLPEITIIVEKRVPDPDALADQAHAVIERVPEVQHLNDHPEVQDAWIEYLVKQWEPWTREMHRWQEVQSVYEDVDFMRRRIEEAEERYELVLAIGLLQWRDPAGSTIKRHLLTAPAEITLDAARGVLTVSPAASFEKFRIELDMLELQNQPRLEGAGLDEHLEALDVQVWDKAKVGEILRIIANRASPDAQVDENAMKPLERSDETFRVIYAPALVLREWRPTAYEELINRFLDACDKAPGNPTTKPWERLILEGETSQATAEEPPEREPDSGDEQLRIYFPLPRNEEQQKIAERLQALPYVLVKGPPGTGKSHTIANLICHLLATGERVLVTAHAPKALAVLREKLPSEIRSLCVTALGSTREDQRLLEDSVRGILSRKNGWKGCTWAQREIERLEQELSRLEGECVTVERQLRECREAETYSHTVASYEGTAAQIARKLEHDLETYGWFPELADANNRCPLEPAEMEFLATFHGSLTGEQLKEIGLGIPDCSLPDPETFQEAARTLTNAEQNVESFHQELSRDEFHTLRSFSDADLETYKAFLNALEDCAVRSHRILGDLTAEILKDLLMGRTERWNRLAKDVDGLLKSMQTASQQVGTARLELPADLESLPLLADARRRLTHFQNGGRRGWGFLAPRVVRETRYVEERPRVDGQPPRRAELLNTLVTFLELDSLVAQFFQTWPTPRADDHSDPRRAASDALDLAQELNNLISLPRSPAFESLRIIPVAKRLTLAGSDERRKWLRCIEAEIARRHANQAQEPLDAWMKALHSLPAGSSHPCIETLGEAIERRDVAKWKIGWTKSEEIKTWKQNFDQYRGLVCRLERACAGLDDLFSAHWDNSEWKHRLANLDRAWSWATARAWLRRVSDSDAYRRLGRERHRLQEKIEKKMEELAALKAWDAFFNRLDDKTEQHLTAWTRAVARIGQGTGKHAYRHRRTARQYLMECIPKIPAWIMPLHRLWQTTDPTPGAFDTVVVDEASQAGIESLLLFLLAKRIIVVGDDKQNTPEAVGVLEDDIARLARDHLAQFRFRHEFRPDSSLFDHADRAFGSLISLREHFRCVPEIIRFSNDLCYTDAPLIPLCQPPPNRMHPLCSHFVDTGTCQGDGQRITNQAEADAIVEGVRQCLEDEAYDGKTMGVIVLQGHAQAELIEKRLAELLEPRAREERKFRCGVPATFQGDERDVIFLSLVVAPNHRFRALTGLDDQRRFNVAMSRAREQAWLFHSVQAHDLSREDLRWKLLNFFAGAGRGASDEAYEELERLEREARRYPRHPGDQPAPYESWFEVDVALEFLRRKYRVRPQYEVAGYRIDLVLEGLDNRLAVECDGDAWHGPERWDHDMARQRQLVRARLTFVRIRESEFYADRSRAVEQVLEACEQLGIWPADAREEASRRPTQEEVLDSASGADGNHDDTPEEQEAELESEIASESALKAASGPFSGYSKECGFPDPREGAPASVRTALRQIVEKDGPLPRESVYRLYVEGCPGLQRVGKAVRQALNRAVGTMLRSGEIVQENELGAGSPEGLVVRRAGTPKVLERPAGQRDLLEIPPSELFLVLSRLCSSDIVLGDGSLARSVLEHYGFGRLTGKRRKYFSKVLQAWRSKKEVRQHPESSMPLFSERPTPTNPIAKITK